ncbi:MAG: TlpA family protein disulfide reductase [Candidatus Neomarinimicrobiota bacterium]
MFRSIPFVFLFFTCSKTKLLPISSKELIEKISTFKGKKAVLVNVWALWCKPCVDEFPMILNLQKKTNDLEVIFISADFEDKSKDVIKFLNNHNVGPISYIKRQKDEDFIKGLSPKWSGTLPYTIVYAKKSGLVIDSWEGKKNKLRFENSISLALKS